MQANTAHQQKHMDVTTILREEISRKRKILDASVTDSSKKYMRTIDILDEKQASNVSEADKDTSEMPPKKYSLDEYQTSVETTVDDINAEKVLTIQDTIMPRQSQYAVELNVQARKSSVKIGQSVDKLTKRDAVLRKYESQLGEISPQLFKKDRSRCYTLVYVFWKKLLFEWETHFNNMSSIEQSSLHNKQESDIQKQTADNMKPLFKLLKAPSGEDDVVIQLVVEMCMHMHQREYLKANDAYLRLSIGNAAWPIGVTAVGMHERSADAKIAVGKVAHVLNDETTRKYVQGLKRLMTFCQKLYPNSDHSKMVG